MDSSVELKRNASSAKARLFLVLSLLWIFPSLGSCWIIGSNSSRWFASAGIIEALVSVKFEEWVALGLLLAHTVFMGLAYRYWRRSAI